MFEEAELRGVNTPALCNIFAAALIQAGDSERAEAAAVLRELLKTYPVLGEGLLKTLE